MTMMNRLMVVVALLTVAVAGAFAQPKLEIVGGETYDWGKVKQPKEGYLEATIQMKNVGNRAMKITEVRPGCGCTKTDPDKFELEPGDISTMNVKLNISPAQSGPVTKNITVSWSDLQGSMAQTAFKANGTAIPSGVDTTITASYIWLKADVQRALMFAPSTYFSFDNLKVGQESSANIDLTNNSDQDVILSEWVTDGGLVCSQATRTTLKPGDKITITARVVPSAKGNYAGGVKFKTSHPDHAEVDIRAYGFAQESTSPVFQTQPK